MDEDYFVVYDEDGIERNARILWGLEIGDNEYVVYAMDMGEEEAIMASKVVLNRFGEKDVIDIEDEEEMQIVSAAIRNALEEQE